LSQKGLNIETADLIIETLESGALVVEKETVRREIKSDHYELKILIKRLFVKKYKGRKMGR